MSPIHLEWLRQVGGPEAGLYTGSSAIAKDGSLLLTGYMTGSSIQFGGAAPVSTIGTIDSFLAKYSASNSLTWM